MYAAALPCCYRRHNLPEITGDGGLLFTAQFAAVGLLSAAQFGGCYSRHSLVLRRGGCYSRHNSKPLLFTAHFRFLRKKSGCYRRHNCVWGCYSRHNSAGLLNTAQLPPDILLNLAMYRPFFFVGLLNTAQFRVLLSAAHFVFGLLSTAQFQKRCYLQHS